MTDDDMALWAVVVESGKIAAGIPIDEPFPWRHRTQDSAEATAYRIAEQYDAVVYVAKVIAQYHKEVKREDYAT